MITPSESPKTEVITLPPDAAEGVNNSLSTVCFESLV